MKKSLLLLSLVSPLAVSPITQALAQTTEPSKPNAQTTTSTASTEPKVSVTINTADQPPLEKEKEKEKEEEIQISASDLKKGGVKVEFKKDKIILTGELPQACADRLSIGNVEAHEDVKELKNAKILKEVDAESYTKVYELEIHFRKSESIPSLKDCLAQNKKEKKSPLTGEAFEKDIELNPDKEYARVKLTDSDDVVLESKALKELRSKLAKFNCENCNENMDAVLATLSDSQKDEILGAAREKLLEETIAKYSEEIDKMKESDLDDARNDLKALNEQAINTQQTERIAMLLDQLTVRYFNIAKSTQDRLSKQRADKATKFATDTLKEILKLKNLPADVKDTYKERMKDFEKGSIQYAAILGELYPEHPEFLAKVAESQRAQNKLLGEWMTYCSAQARAYAGTFTLCARAESEYRAGMVGFNQLQNLYSTTHAQDYSFLAQGAGANANVYGSTPTANLMQNGANGMPMMMNQQQNPAVKPLTSAYSDFVNPYIYQGVIAQNNQPVANAMPGQQVLQNHSPQPTIMLQ